MKKIGLKCVNKFFLFVVFGFVFLSGSHGQQIQIKPPVTRKLVPQEAVKKNVMPITITRCFQSTNGTSGQNRYIEFDLEGTGFGNHRNGKYVRFGNHEIHESGGCWTSTLVVRGINIKLIAYGQKYVIFVAIKDKSGKEIRLSNIVYLTPLMLIHRIAPQLGPPGILFTIEDNSVTTGFFGNSQGARKLIIGNREAEVELWEDEKIVARVPVLPPGNHQLCIRNNLRTVSQIRHFKVLPMLKEKHQ